jgi:uncharacterized protein
VEEKIMAGSPGAQARTNVDKVCHFEIGVRDYERVKKFYSTVFNWRFEANSGGHESIRTGDDVGGHLHVREQGQRNYTVMYIMVEDVPAAIQRAESAGGKVVLGPEKEGERGTYAWIADPEGNVVGVYTQE